MSFSESGALPPPIGGSSPGSLPPDKKEDRQGSLEGHRVEELPDANSLASKEREAKKIDRVSKIDIPPSPHAVEEGAKQELHIERGEKRTPLEERLEKTGKSIIRSEQEHSLLPEPLLSEIGPVSAENLSLADIAKPKPERQAEVETGLLPAILFPGASRGPFSIEQRMEDLRVPGVVVAVISDGKKDWVQGYGEMKQKDKFSEVASISKIVTSLTVLSLVRSGKIRLEDDAENILGREFWEKIDPSHTHHVTIAQLLSHTACMTHGKETHYYSLEVIDEDIRRTRDLERMLLSAPSAETDRMRLQGIQERLQRLEALREEAARTPIPSTDDLLPITIGRSAFFEQPGKTQVEYSNLAYTILQKIVEATSGEASFAEAVQKSVLRPLGMEQTTYSLPPVADMVPGNFVDGTPYPGLWEVIPEKAAGGMISNAEELIKLVLGLQGALTGQDERVISQDLAQKMVRGVAEDGVELSPPMKERGFSDYGLGIGVERAGGHTYFMHDGGWPGYKSILIANEVGQGAVILTNSDNGDALYPEIIRSIAKAYGWPGCETLAICRPKVNPEETAAAPINGADWADEEGGVGGTYIGLEEREGEPPIEHTVTIHFDQEKGEVLADIDGGETRKGGETLPLTPLGENVACYFSHPPGPYREIVRFTNEGGKLCFYLWGVKHSRKEG